MRVSEQGEGSRTNSANKDVSMSMERDKNGVCGTAEVGCLFWSD